MDGGPESSEFSTMIAFAAAIAIILALVVTGYMVIFTEKEHSSLYVVPESYQTTPLNDRVSFTYGIVCSEEKVTDYEVQIYLYGNLVATEYVRLDHNERYEKNEELPVTGPVSGPGKVEVILTNLNTMETEQVHIWVGGDSETSAVQGRIG